MQEPKIECKELKSKQKICFIPKTHFTDSLVKNGPGTNTVYLRMIGRPRCWEHYCSFSSYQKQCQLGYYPQLFSKAVRITLLKIEKKGVALEQAIEKAFCTIKRVRYREFSEGYAPIKTLSPLCSSLHDLLYFNGFNKFTKDHFKINISGSFEYETGFEGVQSDAIVQKQILI